MTHDRIIKAFHVQHTDLEKCNTGLQNSISHTYENQMCVRLPIKYYSEIVGSDPQAASSSTSRTTVIEKVLYTYTKFWSTLKEMVLCFYLTEFVREFLCKLERKSSYFSYIILCVNKYE